MSHDQVRSTTHRLGSTSNRWSWILLTTSAEMWWAPQAAMKVLLNPPSHQIFFSRPVPGSIHDGDPTRVVRHTGRHHDHCDENPEGVDDTEGLAPRHLLPGVVTLGRAGDRRRTPDAPGVDHLIKALDPMRPRRSRRCSGGTRRSTLSRTLGRWCCGSRTTPA